jgi:hypothetical protein
MSPRRSRFGWYPRWRRRPSRRSYERYSRGRGTRSPRRRAEVTAICDAWGRPVEMHFRPSAGIAGLGGPMSAIIGPVCGPLRPATQPIAIVRGPLKCSRRVMAALSSR